MTTLIIVLLVVSHVAAFFAGAHNAKRAASIKSGVSK